MENYPEWPLRPTSVGKKPQRLALPRITTSFQGAPKPGIAKPIQRQAHQGCANSVQRPEIMGEYVDKIMSFRRILEMNTHLLEVFYAKFGKEMVRITNTVEFLRGICSKTDTWGAELAEEREHITKLVEETQLAILKFLLDIENFEAENAEWIIY